MTSFSSLARAFILPAILLMGASAARATWIGALTGTTNDASHEFLNAANWSDGVVGEFGSAAFTAATTLYVKSNFSLSEFNGLNVNAAGTLTIQSSGGPFTMTLNGPMLWNGSRTLSLGTTTTASKLNVNLGGANREIFTGLAATYGVSFTNDITNGGIIKTGTTANGTLGLSGPTSFTGPLVVRSSAYSLTDGGGQFGTDASTDIRVMSYDAYASSVGCNGIANANIKLPDASVIRLYGASGLGAKLSLSYTGQCTGSYETVGEVKSMTGLTDFYIGDFGALTGVNRMAITANTLSRYNNALVRVYADSTARNTLGTETRLMLGNGSDLLVGGGSYTAGATDNPILPFVYGSPNASNAVDSIYTYDPARGVVPLGASEYATALDGSETAKNVKLNNLTASYAGGTVKSLLLTASATNTVTLTGTLNVTSGLIVRQNSNAKLAGGTINFGSAEGFLYADNGVTWNSALTNDSGNTKGVTLANYFSSVGGVINGTNTYSGPTNIISGSWSFQGGNAIPNGSSVYVHPAVTARLAEGTGNVVEKMARLSGGGPWESGFGNSEDSKSAPAFITVGTGDTVLIGNTSRGAADYDRIVLNGDGVTNGILSPGFDAAGTEIGTLGLYSIASGYVPSTGYAMDMVAGKWMVDVNSTLADLIRAPLSNITVASGVALNINVLAGSIFTDGQSWMIATASGITDVDGGNLFSAITDNSAGFDFTASIADGNKVMVTAVAVPEPFTLLLLGSGGIGLLLRRRNR